MNAVQNFFKNLFTQQEGQTLAEYALVLVLIAIVAILALTALGVNISNVLTNIGTAI
jgi:pilus assembly protein Flp/PilA